MEQVTNNSFAKANDSDVYVFATVKNEISRLPYFLQYYRGIGASHFFLVDNQSNDGSLEYLRELKDVTLYQTSQSYNLEMRGVTWLDDLRLKYAKDKWCLTVDIDELLVYPDSENSSLVKLCAYLDANNYDGLFTVMLDFYDDKKLRDYTYVPGTPFVESSPYFDSRGYFVRPVEQFPHFGLFGGPRYRSFYREQTNQQGPTMRKIPLIKWGDGVEYLLSTHATPKLRLANLTGAILHFRFLVDFKSLLAAENDKSYIGLKDHIRYLAELANEPERNLVSDVSERYKSSEQMVRLGLLKDSKLWRDFARTNENCADQSIQIRKSQGMRHKSFAYLWESISARGHDENFKVSVVIPIGRANRYFARAVKSALNQLEVAEILLIDNGASDLCRDTAAKLTLRHSKVSMLSEPLSNTSSRWCILRMASAAATMPYIAFLDPNDRFMDARFAETRRVFLANPDFSGVYTAASTHFESYEASDAVRPFFSKHKLAVTQDIPASALFENLAPLGKYGAFHISSLTLKTCALRNVSINQPIPDTVLHLYIAHFFLLAHEARLVLSSSVTLTFERPRIKELCVRSEPDELRDLFLLMTQQRGNYVRAYSALKCYFSALKGSKDRSPQEGSIREWRRNKIAGLVADVALNARSYLFLFSYANRACRVISRSDLKALYHNIGVKEKQFFRVPFRELKSDFSPGVWLLFLAFYQSFRTKLGGLYRAMMKS